MEALILAAGYATRLGELTANRAKPLLPVGPKPMIDYIFDQLAAMPAVTRVSVVTNQKFAAQFEEWAASHSSKKRIEVVNDGTTSDADKLGAIGDIRLVVDRLAIDDNLMIVAGDNLFDFDLTTFVSFFHQKGTSIGLFDTHDLPIMTQYAVVEVDANRQIIAFEEKPKAPRSTLAATAIYLWKQEHVGLLQRYASGGGNMDAPGHYHQWLTKQVPVYGFAIPGEWRDIGNKEQYEQAQSAYESRTGAA